MEYIWGMKKIALLVFCFFLFKGYGQNLVPNYSFEVYDTCPSGGGINYAPPWLNPTSASPDYYNQCAISGGASVPTNVFGYQYAHTGVAYAGICVYGSDSSNNIFSAREYIEIELTDSLIANHRYCVNFYVNLADKISSTYNVAISEIGLLLSISRVNSSNAGPLPNTPQILSPVGMILDDSINWTLISGNYLAIGGERYITIGNFSNDVNTDTMEFNSSASIHGAYYYLDDISVVQCNVGIDEANAEVSSFNLSPNPNNGQMTLSYHLAQAAELSIYDMQGRRLITYTLPPNNQTLNLNLDQLNAGIYYYSLHTHDKQLKTEKLVIVK